MSAFRLPFAIPLLALLALAGCASQPLPVDLPKANVLPLALDPAFQIRKIKTFYNDPATAQPTTSEPILFERQYHNWGAVDSSEITQKKGHYFSIYWRTSQRADVTVRLEYRQLGTGNHVSAKEIAYPSAKGSYRSQFQITGDEFLEFGRVTSWRALLIVDNRIVAFRQSFLW